MTSDQQLEYMVAYRQEIERRLSDLGALPVTCSESAQGQHKIVDLEPSNDTEQISAERSLNGS